MDEALWYYVTAERQRQGPVPAAVLRDLAAAGTLGPRSLVWREGMAQWQPLEEVAGRLGLAATTPPAPPAPPVPAIPAAPTVDASDVVDAGFWKRLAALMIDGVLLLVVLYAIVVPLLVLLGVGVGGLASAFEPGTADALSGGPLLAVLLLGIYVLPFVMRWAYFSLFTASSWQATPGKRAVGIKVVDLDGRRLSKTHATGRWFAAALSYLTVYVGFLMAAFTDRKQALHDLVAGTRVVDQWAYTAHPERQQRGLGGCAIAALVGIGLLLVLLAVATIAAVALPAYQDYARRAKLAEVVAEARGMTVAIDTFLRETDRCPATLEEAGLAEPASALVESTDLGEIDAGRCSLRFTLGGAGASSFRGESLWFSHDGEGGWDCGGSMEDRLLPAGCRG